MNGIISKKTEIDPLQQDTINEAIFLKVIEKSKLPDLQKEVTIMIKVYNEQLEQAVRLRFDLEMATHMILAEPQNNAHAEQKVKTQKALTARRAIIRIVRKQIGEKLKGVELSGKKD